MATYDPPTGIQLPSVLKNENPDYALISLDRNHTKGIGYFTSVGIEGSSTDVNNAWDDTERYLVNCPIDKRSLNFVAILGAVTTAEETALSCFAESADPSVYIYKGPYTNDSGGILDADWINSNNWVPVGSGGTGNVSISIDGSIEAASTTDVDFNDVDYRTAVSYTADQVVYSLPDDIALAGSTSVRLGEPASDIINQTSTPSATGIEILSDGTIKSFKNGGTTTVYGSSVTSGTFTGATANMSNAVYAGDQGGQYSSMTPSQVTSGLGNFTSITGVQAITGQETTGLKVSLTNSTSSLGHLKLGFGAPATTPSTINNNSTFGTASIQTNSDLYFHNILLNATQEVSHVLALDGNNQVKRVPIDSIGGTGSVNLLGTSGVIVTEGPTATTISGDSGVLSFLALDQNIPAGRGIARLEITGDAASPLSQYGASAVGNGLAIADAAIDQIDFFAPHQGANFRLLFRATGIGFTGVSDGKVMEGPTLAELFNQQLIAGNDIKLNINPANETITVSVDPVHIRNDEDDSSLYDLHTARLGVELVRQVDVEEQLAVIDPALGQPDWDSKWTELQGSSTVIEWVRRGGTGGTTQEARDAGVIMKSGFTATQSPGTQQGLSATKFRFSAKTPGVNEIQTQSEELGGSYSFDFMTTSLSTYDSSNNDFAIQIGTGGQSSLGDRYNEVLIPNLLAGSLSTDGPNYLAGGGTLGGNWNITGNLNIGGDLTIDGATVGGASVDFAGTLLNLGTPQTGYSGNTSDTADIGIAGLFNWSDADTDNTLDDAEGQITAFFRDGSTNGSNTIYFQNDLSTDPTDNKPYKLMTSVDATDAPSITQLNEVDGKTAYTPLEVGGLALKGWDLDDTNVSANHTTGYVNRITTRIQDAYDIESSATLNDAWNTWGDTSIPTTKAVYDHVLAATSGITGFSADEVTSFDYGITAGEIANDTNTYASGDAHHILVTADDGGTAKFITPENLGLALDADADTTGRGQIGFMPESVELHAGTSLRAVLKKILTQYVTPTITMDVNSEFYNFFPASDHYSYVTENGVDTFGDQGTNTIELKVVNDDNANTITVEWYKSSNLDVEDATQTDVTTSGVITLTDSISLVSGTPDESVAGQKTWSLDFDVDTDTNDFNGLGDGPHSLNLTSGAEATLSIRGKITSFTDSDYFTSAPTSTKSISVRRRSFYFMSDFNAREYILSGGTLDDVVGSHYAHLDGTATTTTGTGRSNKLMHYILCMMNAGGDAQLLTDGTNVIQNSAGADLTMAGLIGVSADGTNAAASTSVVRAKSMIDSNVSQSGVGTGINWVPYSSAAVTDITDQQGMLAPKNNVTGSGQNWKRNTLSTSPNGFYYMAIPIEFAGTGLSTDWYDSGHKFKQEFIAGTAYYPLVLNSAGTAPAVFRVVNKFGEEGVYVLMQGPQPMGGSASSGSLPDFISA